MYRNRFMILLLLVVIAVPAFGALAQDATPTISLETNFSAAAAIVSPPPAYTLTGFRHEFQGWNNCGPATLTTALTYFGYANDQYTAASFLKPNSEDKNVSPWQMAEFVNTQVPGTTQAVVRYGMNIDMLKSLIANGFVVIIEAGYDPEPERLGWMGHYLLVAGYDDARQVFITQDSYLGPNQEYTYEHVNNFWRHFNRTFITLYDVSREAELMALLGDNADEGQNAINALQTARAEAQANPEDPFAWFNMGTSFVDLGMYEEAAVAYDQARTVSGLPWRMLWYQFGPYEAYNRTGRYSETLTLTSRILNDGGGQYVEETFFYAGQAREGMGEAARALDNYRQAAFLNPNYHEAVAARDRLEGAV